MLTKTTCSSGSGSWSAETDVPLLLEPRFCREKREKREAHDRGRRQHGLGQRPCGSKDLRMLLSRSRKALEGKHFLFPCFLRLLVSFCLCLQSALCGSQPCSGKGLRNSMKLWATPCRATQDGRLIMERSDKTWSIGGGNSNPLPYPCLESLMDRGDWRATVHGVKKKSDTT